MVVKMQSNLEKYKKDLDELIKKGEMLSLTLQYKNDPQKFKVQIKKYFKDKNEYKMFIDKFPSFEDKYQEWYSEALEVVRQLLPNRREEFESLYFGEKRKEISATTYTIQDWLLGIRAKVDTLTGEKHFDDFIVVFMRFQNQLAILKSIKRRFKSSLFDIQELVQADLFDSEIDVAKELLKNGFLRAAGAIAGVVLEKHLKQVCFNHKVKVKKRNPHISDYNDLLKKESIIDTPNWRFIQRLGDIRNLCVHKKDREPTGDEVDELIKGTEKIINTLF